VQRNAWRNYNVYKATHGGVTFDQPVKKQHPQSSVWVAVKK
jgi:hypothetical protein